MTDIYLDNNATTPLFPKVAEKILEVLSNGYGNPSSAHRIGRLAKSIVEDAREQIAGLVSASSVNEVIFTSGGTEADNWALSASIGVTTAPRHLVTTAVEHEAIRKAATRLEMMGTRVSILGVDGDGNIDLQELESALTDETDLVSVMLANNETGVIFPLRQISEIVRNNSNALVHSDAVNAAGKISVDVNALGVDLLSLSAHKMGGPKGIGALWIRSGIEIHPIFVGGGQENNLRAGTEAVHQIAGFGMAAEISSDLDIMRQVGSLRDYLEEAIIRDIDGCSINGGGERVVRLPNTSNISFHGVNGEVVMSLLDEAGVHVSTGSACNSDTRAVSSVLKAMNVPFEIATGSIRFSLGRANTREEIDHLLSCLPGILGRARQFTGFDTVKQ